MIYATNLVKSSLIEPKRESIGDIHLSNSFLSLATNKV